MSTLMDFGIPGIGSGILQPKLKNLWRVQFINMGGGVSSQPLSMQCVTATRPSYNFAEIELNRYNSKGWVAGKHTFEPMNLTVEDDVTGSAAKVIQQQVQRQKWLTGAEGPWLGVGEEGSLYKFATVLQMLDGKEQVIERWVMEGCWLQSVDHTDLDYADSEKVLINLVVRYDHARQDIGGYNAGEGVAVGGAGPN
jgi:hypothetical protein